MLRDLPQKMIKRWNRKTTTDISINPTKKKWNGERKTHTQKNEQRQRQTDGQIEGKESV